MDTYYKRKQFKLDAFTISSYSEQKQNKRINLHLLELIVHLSTRNKNNFKFFYYCYNYIVKVLVINIPIKHRMSELLLDTYTILILGKKDKVVLYCMYLLRYGQIFRAV